MKALQVCSVLLLIALPFFSAFAQESQPAQVASNFAPQPIAIAPVQPVSAEKPAPHKFFDGQQLRDLYIHTGMRVADTIKTCRELSHGGVEDWIPSQSCGGIAAWQAGSVGLTLSIGWLFHKTGHHRLERITPWVATGASAAGWTKSVFNIR